MGYLTNIWAFEPCSTPEMLLRKHNFTVLLGPIFCLDSLKEQDLVVKFRGKFDQICEEFRKIKYIF